MKNLILILTLCVMAKTSFAKTVNPSIDEDLEFRFETEFNESRSNFQRGVANAEEEKVQDVEPNKKSQPENGDKKERDVASDEEVFDKVNENGIKYWKY